jgi:hypothetical protein
MPHLEQPHHYSRDDQQPVSDSPRCTPFAVGHPVGPDCPYASFSASTRIAGAKSRSCDPASITLPAQRNPS